MVETYNKTHFDVRNRYHKLKSLRQKKSQALKEINFKMIQMQKSAPSNVMYYQSHRLLKLRTVNSHARVPELGLQI